MHYGLTEKQKILLKAFMPTQFVKQKQAFGTSDSLAYIPGNYVNEILDTVFGVGGWFFEIKNSWRQDAVPFLQKNYKDPNAAPKKMEQAPFANVLGRLTYFVYPQKDYPDEDISKYEPIQFFKEAFGSQVFIGKSDVQQSAFKAAGTDALKKCATLIGVGRELYSKEDISEFVQFRTWLSELTENRWNNATIEYYNSYIQQINQMETYLEKADEKSRETFKKELYKRLGIPEDTKDYRPLPNNVVKYAEEYKKLLKKVVKQ